MPDGNLFICEIEDRDSEFGLLEDTHIKDVVDFSGYINLAYKIV
jgi:hypothetical protein